MSLQPLTLDRVQEALTGLGIGLDRDGEKILVPYPCGGFTITLEDEFLRFIFFSREVLEGNDQVLKAAHITNAANRAVSFPKLVVAGDPLRIILETSVLVTGGMTDEQLMTVLKNVWNATFGVLSRLDADFPGIAEGIPGSDDGKSQEQETTND